MLESGDSLLPALPQGEPPRQLRAVTLGLEPESLNELDRLLSTLGVESSGRILGSNRKIHPATYFGEGKINEVLAMMTDKKADVAIIDIELSPNQLRNLEKKLTKPTVDRPGVIIEIFSRHARSKEAKTQVELARLEYLLPRLAHYWTHFERQRGGIGQKGMGEKQIEVDRRLVKTRMSVLQKRLKTIENERSTQRKGRSEVLKAALVGYTNAGKSTLLNALTHSEVRAEDKLFATLDPSIRALDPHSRPPVVMIDTVGFIHNLPTSLVASFRSTLESLAEADLLIHVVDASSARARQELEVTEDVLKELKLEAKPRWVILNKADLLKGAGKNLARLVSPGALSISALKKDDVDKLRDRILEHFRKVLEVWEVVIPYDESKLEAQLRSLGAVESTKYLEKGTFYRVRIESAWAKKLGLEKYHLAGRGAKKAK